MRRYEFIPDLRKRKHGEKFFLYNPQQDIIVEVNSLSWHLLKKFCVGLPMKKLAADYAAQNNIDGREFLSQLNEVKKALIKWGFLRINE